MLFNSCLLRVLCTFVCVFQFGPGPQVPYSQYNHPGKPQYPNQQPLPSPTYGPPAGAPMRPNAPYPNGQNPYMNQGQFPPTRPTMNGQTYNHFNSTPTQNNFQVGQASIPTTALTAHQQQVGKMVQQCIEPTKCAAYSNFPDFDNQSFTDFLHLCLD